MKQLYFNDKCFIQNLNCNIKIKSQKFSEILKECKNSFPSGYVKIVCKDDTSSINIIFDYNYDSDDNSYGHKYDVFIPENKLDIFDAIYNLFYNGRRTLFLKKLLTHRDEIMSEINFISMNYRFFAAYGEDFLLAEAETDSDGVTQVGNIIFSETSCGYECEDVKISFNYLFDKENNIDEVSFDKDFKKVEPKTKENDFELVSVSNGAKIYRQVAEDGTCTVRLNNSIIPSNPETYDSDMIFYSQFVNNLANKVNAVIKSIDRKDYKKKSLIIKVYPPTTEYIVLKRNDTTNVQVFNTFPMTQDIWNILDEFDVFKECIIEAVHKDNNKKKVVYNKKAQPKSFFTAFTLDNLEDGLPIEVSFK